MIDVGGNNQRAIPDSVRRWMIFVLASLLFVLSQFYRVSVAVITPDLISELSLDPGALSLISAAFFYAFAITQIPIGMYLDGIGPRWTMTVLSLIGVGGAITFAAGQSVAALVAGRVLMGVGMACNLMGTLKLITLWFSPKYFATLSALVVSAGTMGNLAAATPLVLLAHAIGWRYAFVAIGALNLLLVLVFYCIARDRPTSSIAGEVPQAASTRFKDIVAGLRHLFRTKDYWFISLGTFCRYGIFAAVQALWAGPFLVYAMGLSTVSAGNLLVMTSIGVIVGSPLTGWLSDTVFHRRKAVIVPGLIGSAAILFVWSQLAAGTGMMVLGVLFFLFGFLSSSGGIMYAHIKERMPAQSAGAAMTGVNFFTMVGVGTFMQGLGHMMQSLHPGEALGSAAFVDAFRFCAICLLVTAVCYLFTAETIGGRKKI